MAEIQLPPYPPLGLKLNRRQLIDLYTIMRRFARDAVLLNTANSGEGEGRQPFNLEAAKLGEPLVTRDGRPARFVAYVPEDKHHPIVAVVDNRVTTYSTDGLFQCEGCASARDLFMAPKPKRTVWVNFYADGQAHWYSTADAAEDALDVVGLTRVVPVEIDA